MRFDGYFKYVEFLFRDICFSIILFRKNCVIKLIVKYYYDKGNYMGGTN